MIDAYVFVRSADPDTIANLRKQAGDDSSLVRYAAAISGPYDAIVAIAAPDLGAVQRTVFEDVRGAGATDTETVLAIGTGSVGAPKRGPASVVEAFVQVRVEPGHAGETLDRLEAVPGVVGAALVAGAFDILLEVAGQTFEEVSARVIDSVGTVPGVLSTQSFFTAEIA